VSLWFINKTFPRTAAHPPRHRPTPRSPAPRASLPSTRRHPTDAVSPAAALRNSTTDTRAHRSLANSSGTGPHDRRPGLARPMIPRERASRAAVSVFMVSRPSRAAVGRGSRWRLLGKS
jgi:hypothetical protein